MGPFILIVMSRSKALSYGGHISAFAFYVHKTAGDVAGRRRRRRRQKGGREGRDRRGREGAVLQG